MKPVASHPPCRHTPPPASKPCGWPRDRARGSLLVVAMILSAVIGISLASYLQMGRTTMTISNRALYNNAAMNLAENGLEEAMYSINKMVADDTYVWTSNGWTASGTDDVWRRLPASGSYTFDQNATGVVKVHVYNYLGNAAPVAVARAAITLGGGSSRTIEKWVEVQLAKTSKFANGLVAKETINFKGNNATVDSWNSDPDNDKDPADVVAYSEDVNNDNGSVGSISIVNDAVDPNNANIYGYVATGGSPATVGPNGLIGPFDTAEGTIAPGHSSTDFSASFDDVTAPAVSFTGIAAITDNYTLPDDTGVSPAADGKYYISCSKVEFNNASLKVSAGKEVILKLTDTFEAIKIGGGSGELNIASGAILQIYAEGSIDIAGKGILNGGSTTATANQPSSCQIWGTKTSLTQDISIKGQGVLSAVVYAPYGSVDMNGDTDVMGSIVANDITVVGNAKFHYDESLANFDTGNPYRVALWKELTTADSRSAYSGVLSW